MCASSRDGQVTVTPTVVTPFSFLLSLLRFHNLPHKRLPERIFFYTAKVIFTDFFGATSPTLFTETEPRYASLPLGHEALSLTYTSIGTTERRLSITTDTGCDNAILHSKYFTYFPCKLAHQDKEWKTSPSTSSPEASSAAPSPTFS